MDKTLLYDRLLELMLRHNGSITPDSSGNLMLTVGEFKWLFTHIPTANSLLDCQIRLESHLLNNG